VSTPLPSYADARPIEHGDRAASVEPARTTVGLPPIRRPAWKRLAALSFPRRFPIVQFPNLPLIVAFVASQAGRVLSSAETPYARSISYLAMTIWAYEELVDGVNWFRRLLGLTYAVIMVVRVAHALMHG
jgi:hypothetical protein